MSLLTEKDFETKAGQKRIIYTIYQLEIKLRELNQLVHDQATQKITRRETWRDFIE